MRDILCCLMIVLLPASLIAADSGAAIVRPYGPAWLNGVAVEQSSAIFPGDLAQTGSSSALKIRASGSSITVMSDSTVRLGEGQVSVEHGSVQMITAKSMFARAGIITATPAASDWTEFELTHRNGAVEITALKGELRINNGSEITILAPGQQTTQKDSEQPQDKDTQAPVPAAKKSRKGVIILAVAGGAAAVAIVAVVASSIAGAGTPRSISPITP